MVLLSGGVDGGTISHVTQLAEIIKTSNPKPRLGINYKNFSYVDINTIIDY